MPPDQTRPIYRPIALSSLLGVVLVISAVLCACGAQPKPAEAKPGLAAPDFTLEAARGGTHRLEALREQVVLLSFLNTQADASAEADPSRSQIAFLKSMLEQYGPKETVVLIVDASRLATGKTPNEDNVLNFTYDWQLDGIPVLMDDRSGTVAQQYGVTELPTTFLIDAEGVIQQRWDGFASAPQLALALEALVGPPAFREAEATAPIRITCPGETPAQAKFAGVGLARPLSEEIWAVDGGQVWGSGGGWPLQWVVLDRGGKIKEATPQLQVVAFDLGTNEGQPLVDETLELLPADEAEGLLVGQADPRPDVYLLVTSVELRGTGCFRIEAVIAQDGSVEPLYVGQAIVPVK